MGKKTNWTATEDLTLCRAWINASDAVLPQPTGDGDQKASTFWNVVYHIFHAELDTSIERPHNGLKIRWSRINRDVQRFALIFAQLHALAAELKGTSATTAAASAGAVGLGDAIESDVHAEQQCIDDAKEQFFKEHDTKFLFEACWKLLRYSTKWVHLLASSAGVSTSHSGATGTHHFLNVDAMPRIEDVAGATAEISGGSNCGISSHSGNKRRAVSLLDTLGRGPIQQLQDITSSLVDEMKRRNELLEEQNAIALFRLETDIIEDDDAREVFEQLRRRYVKKLRASLTSSSSSSSSAVAAASVPTTSVPAGATTPASASSTPASSLGDVLADSASVALAVSDAATQQQQHHHHHHQHHHVVTDSNSSKSLDQRSTSVV